VFVVLGCCGGQYRQRVVAETLLSQRRRVSVRSARRPRQGAERRRRRGAEVSIGDVEAWPAALEREFAAPNGVYVLFRPNLRLDTGARDNNRRESTIATAIRRPPRVPNVVLL